MAAEAEFAPFAAMIATASSDEVRNELASAWILRSFEHFYKTFTELTWRAERAFETRGDSTIEIFMRSPTRSGRPIRRLPFG